MLQNRIVKHKVHDFLLFGSTQDKESRRRFATCHSVFQDYDSRLGSILVPFIHDTIYLMTFSWSDLWYPIEAIVYFGVPTYCEYQFNSGPLELCKCTYGSNFNTIEALENVRKLEVDSIEQEGGRFYDWHSVTLTVSILTAVTGNYHRVCDLRSDGVAKLHKYLIMGSAMRGVQKAQLLGHSHAKLQRISSQLIVWWVFGQTVTLAFIITNMRCGGDANILTRWVLSRPQNFKIPLNSGISYHIIPSHVMLSIISYVGTNEKLSFELAHSAHSKDWCCVCFYSGATPASAKGLLNGVACIGDHLLKTVQRFRQRALRNIYESIKVSFLL